MATLRPPRSPRPSNRPTREAQRLAPIQQAANLVSPGLAPHDPGVVPCGDLPGVLKGFEERQQAVHPSLVGMAVADEDGWFPGGFSSCFWFSVLLLGGRSPANRLPARSQSQELFLNGLDPLAKLLSLDGIGHQEESALSFSQRCLYALDLLVKLCLFAHCRDLVKGSCPAPESAGSRSIISSPSSPNKARRAHRGLSSDESLTASLHRNPAFRDHRGWCRQRIGRGSKRLEEGDDRSPIVRVEALVTDPDIFSVTMVPDDGLLQRGRSAVVKIRAESATPQRGGVFHSSGRG